jgi:hypothetical protein
MIHVGSHHLHIHSHFSSEANGADQAIRGMCDAEAEIVQKVCIGLHGGLPLVVVLKADACRMQPEILRQQFSHEPVRQNESSLIALESKACRARTFFRREKRSAGGEMACKAGEICQPDPHFVLGQTVCGWRGLDHEPAMAERAGRILVILTPLLKYRKGTDPWKPDRSHRHGGTIPCIPRVCPPPV